jgi:HNH endonuclease
VSDKVPSVPYRRQCDQCSTEFRVRPCEVRKAIQRGCEPPRFCSRACRDKSYQGAGNPKWRGGRTISASGYVLVLVPSHPQADKDGYYEEHRLVMEQHLGRFLEPTECVHHFNHNRQDNRIENLELMESWAQHQRRHGYYEPRECGNCGTVVMRSRGARRRFPERSYCSRKCAAAGASRASAAARRPA